jgi:uncharacterized membrane protein YkoI
MAGRANKARKFQTEMGFAMKSKAAIFLTCAALTACWPAYADGDDHERARQAFREGKILPLRAVLDIVERDYPGQVVKVEFERDDGRYEYEIRVLQADGNMLKLDIDASDGRVLSVKGKNARSRGRR